MAKVANLHEKPEPHPDVSPDCIEQCILHLRHITGNGGLALDNGGKIFCEYINNLFLSGHPGIGDYFVKWVFNNQWNSASVDRGAITKNNGGYKEFPLYEGLNNFDDSDRKYIAAAGAHPEKPPVLQAVDSKWRGWKQPLKEARIIVIFLCPEFVQEKYAQKMT